MVAAPIQGAKGVEAYMSKMYEALKKAQEQGVPIEVPEPVIPDVPESNYRPDWNPPRPAERIVSSYESDDGDGVRSLPMQARGKFALIPWNASDSAGGEQYRIIRTRIVQHPARPKVMVVSSAGAGDGKTVSAINIAGVLSLRDNANVLLIDADFRRAGVSSALGLPPGPGLSNVLRGLCALQEAIIRVEQFPNLYVLTAGTSDVNPAELLDTDQWKSLCSTVRKHFSFVMIDAPPIAAVADYELIQASCDGVIFVARPDITDRTLLHKALELIPEEKKLGVVLNCASKWFLWKTHESYYYDSRRAVVNSEVV